MFRRNVGGLDRTVRLVLGAILLPLGLVLLVLKVPYALLVTILGLIGLFTGVTGACPLYVPFGISTARRGGGEAPVPAPDRGR